MAIREEAGLDGTVYKYMVLDNNPYGLLNPADVRSDESDCDEYPLIISSDSVFGERMLEDMKNRAEPDNTNQ